MQYATMRGESHGFRVMAPRRPSAVRRLHLGRIWTGKDPSSTPLVPACSLRFAVTTALAAGFLWNLPAWSLPVSGADCRCLQSRTKLVICASPERNGGMVGGTRMDLVGCGVTLWINRRAVIRPLRPTCYLIRGQVGASRANPAVAFGNRLDLR